MITHEEAIKMLENSNTESEVKTPSVETTEEVKEPIEPATDPKDETKAIDAEVEHSETENEIESDESIEKDVKNDIEEKKSVKPSQKEKRDYAFIREKNKRKAQKESYEKRIKELQDELNKYKGLKLEDFKNDNEAYMDYKLDQRDQMREIQEKQNYLNEINQEELNSENERRIDLSFETEEEKDEYRNLLETRGQEFLSALNKYDPDGTVLNYLNNLETYPKVLKVLMTDTEALRNVFIKKDPIMRTIALDKLANKIKKDGALKNTVKVEKKPLPIIGRQTSANSAPIEDYSSDAWAETYLKTHPRGW